MSSSARIAAEQEHGPSGPLPRRRMRSHADRAELERVLTGGGAVSVAVAASATGVLVAEQSRLLPVLVLAPLLWLLLTSAPIRLVVVSFGALLTFQSTSDASPLKAGYLVCFLVALTGALLSLGRDGATRSGQSDPKDRRRRLGYSAARRVELRSGFAVRHAADRLVARWILVRVLRRFCSPGDRLCATRRH